MKKHRHLIGMGIWLAWLAVLLSGCGKKETAPPDVLARFAEAKEKQARELNKKQSYRWPGEASRYFEAMEAGRWNDASNLFAELDRKYNSFAAPAPTNGWDGFKMKAYALVSRAGGLPRNYWPRLDGPQWEPVREVKGAGEAFQKWDPEMLLLFGTNIIHSTPTNSIYFAGSDSGRFVIAALSKSHVDGKPFFTFAQNRLADNTYREYAREVYGSRIQLPNEQDASQVFSVYMQDASRRLSEGKLKPGENVSNSGGRLSVSGQVAIKEINGAFLRWIFENNTNREFYVEESGPVDWMYPHLVPHGPILKINRLPLASLDDSVVKEDRAYWKGMVARLAGIEIDESTSLSRISDFAEAIYLRRDFRGFKGNERFATNAPAQEGFARLRIAIAGVYAWRAKNTPDAVEKQRMRREADLAYREAFALCPRIDALSGYEEMLLSEERTSEAQLLREGRGKFFQRAP